MRRGRVAVLAADAEVTTETEQLLEARITQLETQQSLMTQALKAALEGRWTGENSVEAYLYALAPMLQGAVTPNPPVLSG